MVYIVFSVPRQPKFLISSSTWAECYPDTAYVVCISVSFGFTLYGIHILWFSLYGGRIPWLSLNGHATQTFKRKRHCSGYGVVEGCCGHCIDPEAATVTLQWYDRYCFGICAGPSGAPSNAKGRELMAITSCQPVIHICRISMWFVAWSMKQLHRCKWKQLWVGYSFGGI